MLLSTFFLIISLIVLYFGAEITLSASEKVGKSFGLSPLAIGLLLVGMGTSLPEFFVSQIAAIDGQDSLALGNLLGSNLANVFLVLAIGSLFVPLPVKNRDLLRMIMIHGVMSLVLVLVFSVPVLKWWTVLPLLMILAVYLKLSLGNRHSTDGFEPDHIKSSEQIPLVKTTALLILGLVFLYSGGELLVKSAVDLGTEIGIDPYLISVVFVAFGTSFPELMTTLVATFRKKDTNLILGNIIGSNVFNMAFILPSLLPYELSLKGDFRFELVALNLVSPLLLLLYWRRWTFRKWHGLAFLAIYGGLLSWWF